MAGVGTYIAGFLFFGLLSALFLYGAFSSYRDDSVAPKESAHTTGQYEGKDFERISSNNSFYFDQVKYTFVANGATYHATGTTHSDPNLPGDPDVYYDPANPSDSLLDKPEDPNDKLSKDWVNIIIMTVVGVFLAFPTVSFLGMSFGRARMG